MTNEELNMVLARGEGTRTEYKQARTKVPSDLYESVCAFLNKEGGIIILGADNYGNVTGIDPACMEQMKKDIVTALNNKDVIDPPVNYPIYPAEKDGEKLLCLKIPVSSQVHTCAGVIFDRENDSDFRILDDARKAEIYFRKRQNFTENTIYPHMTMDDLDESLFEKARKLLKIENSFHPWLEMDNMSVLRSAQLYRKDLSTGEDGLTLAAALIFGKDITISGILPAYKIEALVRRDNLDRWDDRLTIRTNLIDSYLQLMDFVKKHLDDRFYLDGDVRKDLRILIFREVIGNIIVHREYTNNFSTEFIIYRDRVEATNPNKVLFRGPLSLENFSPYAKNPNIRRFFSEFRWTDEIGSGVRNVNKYLKIYANGAVPSFIDDDHFKTIVPLLRYTLGTKASWLIELAGLKDKLGKENTDALSNISISSYLNEIDDLDTFLHEIVMLWEKEGVKMENIRLLINSNIQIEELKKELSIEQKGVKLMKKRGLNILKTLLFLLVPCTIDELATYMEFRSKNSYRDDYIKPLRDNDLVAMYNPEKITDPAQKYVITDKGKMFLGCIGI
ncbi:MAG TPA: putative DNA binding domain-containing protein [Bacteroidales bacterium]|nr:putative DNA binding domain-containing protein [Bacteroidales bacterium]